MPRMTYTHAILEISGAAYQEIAKKLLDAGFPDAFLPNDLLSMQGIALRSESPQAQPTNEGKGSDAKDHR